MTASKRIFPIRLRKARELRGLSQAELAVRAGLQASAVSHYEVGGRRPSFANLRRLAQALEVTTDYLVGASTLPTGSPALDEPLYRDFGRLSAADRDLARALIAELANRARAEA